MLDAAEGILEVVFEPAVQPPVDLFGDCAAVLPLRLLHQQPDFVLELLHQLGLVQLFQTQLPDEI